jgi:outer membrane protein TolC
MPTARTRTIIIFIAFCVACTLSQAAATGETQDSPYFAGPRGQLDVLPAIKIDDKYLDNQIQGNGANVLTLKGAIAVADEKNREIQKAKADVTKIRWDEAAVETTRLPNLKVLSYLSQNSVGSTVIPDRANAFVFAAALVPVTQQYRIGLQAKVLKLARAIAAQKLQQEMESTRAKVKTAYYALALDQSTLSDIQDAIKYLEELHKTALDQVNKGDAIKVEAMEVEARIAKAQLDLLKAKNSASINEEKFNLLLGRKLTEPVSLESISPPSELEIDRSQAEARALTNRPEIRIAEAKIKLVNTEKRVILSHYIPDVSIGAVYVGLPGFNNLIIPKNTLAPGIFINWTAFDWGRKVFESKAKTSEERAALLSLQNVRDEIIIDVHSQLNKLTEARLAVSTAQLARSTARESLRVAINRYRVASAKLDEVLERQSNLADSTNKYHKALLEFWEADAQFERAVSAN